MSEEVHYNQPGRQLTDFSGNGAIMEMTELVFAVG